MKKYIAWLFCIGMVILAGCGRALIAASDEDAAMAQDGIFRGTAEGMSGEIVVEVELNSGYIRHIELISHHEANGFEKAAINLSDSIIAKNSLDVNTDEVTQGFLAAVEDALSQAGLHAQFLSAPAALQRSEETEYECDIVIIGAGSAGLCAAIEARSLGVENIIVLEKMSFTGGNTRMSGGGYSAPGNWVQLAEGTTSDSTDIFYSDVYEGGGRLGKPSLIRLLTENALADAYWLRDTVGVRFLPDQLWYEGHTVARTLCTEGSGAQLIDTLLAKAEAMGVRVHYTTRATALECGEGGRVTGVLAERGDKTLRYNASKGVILTCGGFGANLAMCERYDRYWNNLSDSLPSTNSPANTGDGIRMAQEVGANLVGMEYIQLYPISNPATGSIYQIDHARLNGSALLINQEGNRFVNERAMRDELSAAILRQPGQTVYELVDSRTVELLRLETRYAEEIARCRDQAVLIKGTLAQCADYFAIPSGSLAKTVERYNALASRGEDTDFGREQPVPMSEGQYFMFSIVASVHHTMGGVEIDEHARVLDTDGNAIPGLYAAGEVTGGIHGANRLGSAALTDSVVFGRIAGRSAATS